MVLGEAIARGAIWASLALNSAVVWADLVQQRDTAAALQSIVCVVLTAWLWLVPTIDAWLEAQRAEAVADQRIAELAAAEMERLARAGVALRSDMSVSEPKVN